MKEIADVVERVRLKMEYDVAAVSKTTASRQIDHPFTKPRTSGLHRASQTRIIVHGDSLEFGVSVSALFG